MHNSLEMFSFAKSSALLAFTFFLYLPWDYANAEPPKSLKFVSVLYRHGDRSPVNIYPKDINQVPEAWPDGLGWLTNTGKMQQYELGQYLKQRYDGFINTSYYQHNEILIQSSGVDRCLMSAYSNLAGLFSPGPSQMWNKDIPWQPVPVMTSPMATDNKLSENAACPRYDQLMKELAGSPSFKQEERENKAFYDMVVDNTGIEKESLMDIWQIGDTLICEKAHNMTWNDWVYKPGVWEKMLQLTDLSFVILFNNTEMIRLKGGPLLTEIIENMQNASKQTQPLPKFYMYSAHDTTVASLLGAMHVFDRLPPTYRALVMVELHQMGTDHVVKIFYRNNVTAEPLELVPPGCGPPCTLDDFIKVTKDCVPVDWAKECETKNSVPGSLSLASGIALGVSLALCIVIIIGLIVMIIRLRCGQSPVYQRV